MTDDEKTQDLGRVDQMSDDDLLRVYAHRTEMPSFVPHEADPHIWWISIGGTLLTRSAALDLIKLHRSHGMEPTQVITTGLFLAMTAENAGLRRRIEALEGKAWIRDVP